MSDLERAVLDAAMRPGLVGGVAVLVEALTSADTHIDIDRLTRYAANLRWSAAIRRIGSIADALKLNGISQAIQPLKPINSDLDLEPGNSQKGVWRDKRWRIRWPQTPEELANVARQ